MDGERPFRLHGDLPACLSVLSRVCGEVGNPAIDGPNLPGDPNRLFELYKIAVEEYRFQVGLNWSRTQYFLVLNAGLLAGGLGLLKVEGLSQAVPGTVFGAGVIASVLCLVATATQHGYYRSARDGKAALEEALNLGVHAIRTTPGMGSIRHRLGSVTNISYVLLALLALGNLAGVAFVVCNRVLRG